MIIVRLQGGMGNQMFQYALGRNLSLKYGVPLKFDVEGYKYSHQRIFGNNEHIRTYDLDVFNIAGVIAKKSEIPLLNRMYGKGKLLLIIDAIRRRIISFKGRERQYRFDDRIFSLGSHIYLDGWWQSPKYFTEIEDIIRKDFTIKNKIADNIKTLKDEIVHTNSLCIHVRRGDFVGNKHHEVVNTDYYDKGMEQVRHLAHIEKVYVFSDDIQWCKENMKFEFPTMFVGDEYAGEKNEGHMLLMSSCKYFIIPNSSFSWWGAWLSTREDKIVVTPKLWFTDESINTSDLVPMEWIRI
jgi:hypothetical protein